MILRRLFEYLIQFGVICVLTSKYSTLPFTRHTLTSDSRHPTDLYTNGIQRESFLPAIDLLQEKLDVTDLNSGTGKPAQSMFHPILKLYRLPKATSKKPQKSTTTP